MTAQQFFDLLLIELESHQELRGYYRFLESDKRADFRKSYYLQRLSYIEKHLPPAGSFVWDCGCGFGTTNLFLAMKSIRSFGNTLEYYHDQIAKRMGYWSDYGDTTLFAYSYADTFDLHPPNAHYDAIIAQDTLHHLEPLSRGLAMFRKSLKPGGKVIVIEENGANVIQRAKLFARRGTKRVVEVEDPKLGKKVLMGNENIRKVGEWKALFEEAGLTFHSDTLTHIRIFPPFAFRASDPSDTVEHEQRLISKNRLLRRYFAFGINFIATKDGDC